MIGPPLSGKTTFADSISHTYGVPTISIEDLIRDNATELDKLRGEGGSLAEMRYDPAMSRYLRERLKTADLSQYTNAASVDAFGTEDHGFAVAEAADWLAIHNDQTWTVPVGAKTNAPITLDATASGGDAPLACWLPETARLACGGISVCVQSRSSSRTFS